MEACTVGRATFSYSTRDNTKSYRANNEAKTCPNNMHVQIAIYPAAAIYACVKMISES